MRNIDVVCVGEALVDLLPDRRGALEEVETFQRSIGVPQRMSPLGLLGWRLRLVLLDWSAMTLLVAI
jgi:hypothetical protein